MSTVELHARTELYELAMQKVATVLGSERARTLVDRLLQELGIELYTPRDLLALAEAMTQLGGFEGAVGAMLGVAAVMRVQVPTRERPSGRHDSSQQLECAPVPQCATTHGVLSRTAAYSSAADDYARHVIPLGDRFRPATSEH